MTEIAVLTLVIGILIIVVIGAILFWVIDKFCPDTRLAQLLKLPWCWSVWGRSWPGCFLSLLEIKS
jgi:formate hydrogenlyase subunit 4